MTIDRLVDQMAVDLSVGRATRRGPRRQVANQSVIWQGIARRGTTVGGLVHA